LQIGAANSGEPDSISWLPIEPGSQPFAEQIEP